MLTLLHNRVHPTSGRLLHASPVMGERVCVGRAEFNGHNTCQPWPDHYCEACGVRFDTTPDPYWWDRRKCANGCNWYPCGFVGGCEPVEMTIRVCRGFCHGCDQYVRVTIVASVWLCERCMREAMWQLDKHADESKDQT